MASLALGNHPLCINPLVFIVHTMFWQQNWLASFLHILHYRVQTTEPTTDISISDTEITEPRFCDSVLFFIHATNVSHS